VKAHQNPEGLHGKELWRYWGNCYADRLAKEGVLQHLDVLAKMGIHDAATTEWVRVASAAPTLSAFMALGQRAAGPAPEGAAPAERPPSVAAPPVSMGVVAGGFARAAARPLRTGRRRRRKGSAPRFHEQCAPVPLSTTRRRDASATSGWREF
ncbi:unnamed protein product, partial [Prorocentrum cordatum]